MTTIRAAIIFLYIQIFPTRSFLVACYVVLAVNTLFGASAVIADCLICQPITYRWEPAMVDGSCGDQKSLDMFIAIVNFLQDVVVVILPMPILWGLQIARSKKAALSCIFGVGIMYGSQPKWPLSACKADMLTHTLLQDLYHHDLPRQIDLHDRRPNKSARARHILPHSTLDLSRSPPEHYKCLLTNAQTSLSQASGFHVRGWYENYQVFHIG